MAFADTHTTGAQSLGLLSEADRVCGASAELRLAAGSLVWVKSAEEGWEKGVVQLVAPDALDVRLESGKAASYRPEECPLQNPTARAGVEVRLVGTATRGPAVCSISWRQLTPGLAASWTHWPGAMVCKLAAQQHPCCKPELRQQPEVNSQASLLHCCRT